MSQSTVHDSQDGSDCESLILKHSLQMDADIDISSSDKSDAEAITLDNDEILQKVNINKNPIPSLHRSDYVPVKQFNLGDSFDANVATHLQKLEEITSRKTDIFVATSSFQSAKDTLLSLLERDPSNIAGAYFDIVTKETVSGKFIDWHFLSLAPSIDPAIFTTDELYLSNEKDQSDIIKSKYPNCVSLFKALGVAPRLLDEIQTNVNWRITESMQYDTLCDMLPLDTMLQYISYYQDEPDFTRLFLCFILDRKFYQEAAMEQFEKCNALLEKAETLIAIYLTIVDNQDYFMHYRLISMLPRIQNSLLENLFEHANMISLVKEFNNILDRKSYRQLLYFILTVYGSDIAPYGDPTVTEYFISCIDDVSNELQNDIEITIIQGLLNLFLKMKK